MSFVNNIYSFIFIMMCATVFSQGTALTSFILLFLFAIFYCAKNKISPFKNFIYNRNHHFFLLFIISTIISASFGLKPSRSFGAISLLVIFSFAYYPVKEVLSNIKKETILNFPKLIVFISAPFCLYASLKELWLMEAYNLEFKRHFPMIMALISPFYWYYFIKNNQKVSTYLLLANFVLALVVGDNRGAVLTTIIGATIFTLLYNWKSKKEFIKLALFGFIVLSISTGIYLKTNPKAPNRVFTNTIQKLTSGRHVLWDFSISKIAEKPLFGYGAKTFSYQDFEGYNVNTKTHPHNIIIETVLENGIIGFILISYWLFRLIRQFRKNYNKNDEYSIIFMLFSLSFILYFIINLTSISVYRVWFTVFPLYFLLMANVIKEKTEKVS